MKRILPVFTSLFAVTLISLIGYWVAKRISIRALASEDIAVRPFVATEAEYIMTNGKQELVRTETLGRRRDGATSKLAVFYNADGSPKLTARRVELSDGWTGLIVDTTRARSTGNKPAAVVAANKRVLAGSPPQCLWNDDVADGSGTLFGQEALRVIKRVGLRDLARSVEWRLPNFNCVSVAGILEKRADTSSDWQMISAKVLTSFTSTDPDAKMFTGWDDYQEMSPSRIKQQLYQRRGITEEECPKCYAPDTKADQLYAEWNKK